MYYDEMFKMIDTIYPAPIKDTPYKFNGNTIPRVTSILSDMIHEEYLMTWANNVGLYQRKKHTEYTSTACDIGSYSHKAFEIIVNRSITDIRFFPFDKLQIPIEIFTNVRNCIESFIMWWREIVKNHDVEILMQEKELICKYYGGTVDCVMIIDGKVYVVDYKTGSGLSYKYHLQLAAYKIVIETVYNINVDGLIVLLLGKKFVGFEEQIIDTSNNLSHLMYVNNLCCSFLSLVYSYYNRKYTEFLYNKYIESVQCKQ